MFAVSIPHTITIKHLQAMPPSPLVNRISLYAVMVRTRDPHDGLVRFEAALYDYLPIRLLRISAGLCGEEDVRHHNVRLVEKLLGFFQGRRLDHLQLQR